MKYWEAKSKVATHVEEEIPKLHEIKDIQELKYINNGQTIYLPNNADTYHYTKTASADLISGEIEIESRNIILKKGNNTIIIKINEKSQDI